MKTLMRQGAILSMAAVLALVFAGFAHAQDATDTARKIVNKVPPVYPTLARSMNIHGVVKVEAHVAPNGVVKSVDVIGGHPVLTQSAVTAVFRWKFEPNPKETKELVEIKFEQQ
jgi:TonB family protein